MEIYVTKVVRVITEVAGPRVGSLVVQHFRNAWGRSTWQPTLGHALAHLLLRCVWQDPAAPTEATLDDVDRAIDANRAALVRLGAMLVEQTTELQAKQNTAAMKGAFDDL